MYRSQTKLQLSVAVILLWSIPAGAITIATVPIGNIDNVNDPATGYGSVTYAYNIGTTEVTNAQYVAFLNAVAASDPFGLYNPSMATESPAGIVRAGSSGNYTYAVKPNPRTVPYTYGNKPVVYVGWGDAARFANWLNNGQPTGVEGSGTTETGAYTLNGAVTNEALLAVTRNTGATWFIPTHDEWYKTAYYDPSTANYYSFATGSSTVPNHNPPSSDTGNSANYFDDTYTTGNYNYPLTDAGAYTLSHSPYGTFDQNGNVFEWNETALFGRSRGVCGGSWAFGPIDMQASSNNNNEPTVEYSDFGFRVAAIAVPEPSTIAILVIGTLCFTPRRRRPLSHNPV